MFHYKQITRINPTSGLVERPWRNAQGYFVLGDPKIESGLRHKTSEHGVLVDNYGEALELVEQGYSIRMSDGQTSNLVTAKSLTFSDEPTGSLDELWTYTIPAAPFTREQLEAEIRQALVSKAAETYWIAGKEAATAFLGAEFDIDDIEHSPPKFDLARFNFTRLVLAAYESAFRIGGGPVISEEDLDEIEIMIGAFLGVEGRRYPSPADRNDSALRRTMLSAYWRWRISDGTFFTDKTLDQSMVERLAVLAQMTDQAVRNSLNKEKLSAVKGKLDAEAVMHWLVARRGFVPLREDERPETRWTYRLVHQLKHGPIDVVLQRVNATQRGSDPAQFADLKSQIIELVQRGQRVPVEVLRPFARMAELNIDSFVLEFPQPQS